MADADFGTNAEDIDAHYRFFQAATPKNPSATSIREGYFKWYSQKSWYEDNFGPSDERLRQSKSQVAAYNAANGDALSFVPRQMTTEDEAFIKTLQEQGSFSNAVARDVKKVGDAVAGKNLTPAGKIKRELGKYALILGGIGLGALGVKMALSGLPTGRLFDIMKKKV